MRINQSVVVSTGRGVFRVDTLIIDTSDLKSKIRKENISTGRCLDLDWAAKL